MRAISSADRFLKYCMFSHSSFFVSKTALFLFTRSSEKAAISSGSAMISRSSPGDHPRRARKFTSASGRIPSSRNCPTEVAPCRLLRRDPSGPMMSGTCAKSGTGSPSASYRRSCLGVLLTWSSPRMMCVIPIAASSTTQAKL